MNRMLIAAVLVCVGLAICGRTAFAAATPYEINVIVPTSGSASFLGTHETEALGVLEKYINRTGGINGRPVKFVFSDDQTSPVLAVQLTNAIIAKKEAVIIGSSVAATCSAMAPLVEKNGPVQYCLSPISHGAPGSYVFSSSAGSADIAVVLTRFYRQHGWTKLAIITSTDATGNDFEKQFDAALALPENRSVQVVTREHFNGTDLSVGAQMARIKAANPQALITFATGTPLGTLLRGFHDTGMDIPISASAGNMIYAQMAQYTGFLPRQLYFSATRGVAPDPNLRKGPILDAQSAYFAAFKAAGIRPDFASSLTWDPTLIVIDALRHSGPEPTAEKVHAYIEQLHSYAGIDGIYDFRDNSQRGIGQNALVIYHWDFGKSEFTVASRSGGHVK